MERIPDKMFFRIGEVGRIAGVKSYVLRYWESEFKFLKPVKNKAGQRVYRKKDVHLILEIKRLLYDEKFTIAGARRRMEEIRKQRDQEDPGDSTRCMDLLQRIHGELCSIEKMLV
jgi:DNA-binding transcriptional MerR regulator